MPKAKHTGQTDSGHTRDIKVERIGKVTIYKRGLAHYLYFRENGKSVRKPVEGSLASARATAHKVAGSIQEGRPEHESTCRAADRGGEEGEEGVGVGRSITHSISL